MRCGAAVGAAVAAPAAAGGASAVAGSAAYLAWMKRTMLPAGSRKAQSRTP